MLRRCWLRCDMCGDLVVRVRVVEELPRQGFKSALWRRVNVASAVLSMWVVEWGSAEQVPLSVFLSVRPVRGSVMSHDSAALYGDIDGGSLPMLVRDMDGLQGSEIELERESPGRRPTRKALAAEAMDRMRRGLASPPPRAADAGLAGGKDAA